MVTAAVVRLKNPGVAIPLSFAERNTYRIISQVPLVRKVCPARRGHRGQTPTRRVLKVRWGQPGRLVKTGLKDRRASLAVMEQTGNLGLLAHKG